MKINKSLLKKYLYQSGAKNKSICNAPFSLLYISFNGEVFLCCANKKYLIGKYPEQSLEQIWFGESIKKVRETFAQGKLIDGCELCSEAINNELFDSVMARSWDLLPINSNGYPSFIDFELSNVCNLECVMCTEEFSTAFGGKTRESSIFKEDFIKEMETFIPHLSMAAFKGGEPFLIPEYFDVWDKIIKINPNIKISVVTNGTVYNNKIEEFLSRGRFDLRISLDSLQKATYEKIRRGSVFDIVIDNLAQFIKVAKQRETTVTILVCPMTLNWKELPDFVNFCNELGVYLYFNTLEEPKEYSLKHLDGIKQKQVIDFLKEKKFLSNSSLSEYNISIFKAMLDQIKSWQQR